MIAYSVLYLAFFVCSLYYTFCFFLQTLSKLPPTSNSTDLKYLLSELLFFQLALRLTLTLYSLYTLHSFLYRTLHSLLQLGVVTRGTEVEIVELVRSLE